MITNRSAMTLVIAERVRQDKKWGYPQDNTPFEWMSILTEEVGELAEALNDALLGPNANKCLSQAIIEATHVAAVAVSIIEHLSKEST